MALVKTSNLAGKAPLASPADEVVSIPAATQRRSRERQRARREKAAERIGAATEELASGVTEASAAAEELRRALMQIAAALGRGRRSRAGIAGGRRQPGQRVRRGPRTRRTLAPAHRGAAVTAGRGGGAD